MSDLLNIKRNYLAIGAYLTDDIAEEFIVDFIKNEVEKEQKENEAPALICIENSKFLEFDYNYFCKKLGVFLAKKHQIKELENDVFNVFKHQHHEAIFPGSSKKVYLISALFSMTFSLFATAVVRSKLTTYSKNFSFIKLYKNKKTNEEIFYFTVSIAKQRIINLLVAMIKKNEEKTKEMMYLIEKINNYSTENMQSVAFGAEEIKKLQIREKKIYFLL